MSQDFDESPLIPLLIGTHDVLILKLKSSLPQGRWSSLSKRLPETSSLSNSIDSRFKINLHYFWVSNPTYMASHEFNCEFLFPLKVANLIISFSFGSFSKGLKVSIDFNSRSCTGFLSANNHKGYPGLDPY